MKTINKLNSDIRFWLWTQTDVSDVVADIFHKRVSRPVVVKTSVVNSYTINSFSENGIDTVTYNIIRQDA